MINRFVIFGDSYSTHKDYIPEGYPHYYSTEGKGPEHPVTKLTPEQTWWGQMMKRTGATLLHNNSWSGSTIGYTGYAGDCSTSSSFIYRYRKLVEKGFFSKNGVDTIFVFGGTNDSWSGAPLGEEKYSDFSEKELFNVLPAICYFMITLKSNHPDARIVFIGNCDIKREIIECMKHVGEQINVEFVELHGIDKIEGHPSALGMMQICDQVIKRLES